MHPGIDAETPGKYWVYPDSFDIRLSTDSLFAVPNDPSKGYLFQIDNAVLERMSVDYAGSGIPSFFGETGAPVDIRMTLEFKELNILTRKKVIQGF